MPSVKQCSSSLEVHSHHGTVGKCRFNSVGPQWGLSFCISRKFQSEADAASFLESSKALKLLPRTPKFCLVVPASGDGGIKENFLNVKHCIELLCEFY